MFAAALSISYHNFSSLNFDQSFMTTVHTSSNRFFQKRKALSDERVVSKTKNEYGSALNFL